MRRPLQLLLLIGSFALSAYVGVRLLAGDWFGVVLWFVGAALVHDLVLVPLYGLADRVLVRGFEAVGRRAYVNYLRVPAALSGLLLLVWFPLISGRVADSYRAQTGLAGDGFLSRWLLVTAFLFGASALVLVLRLVLSRSATKQRPPAVH